MRKYQFCNSFILKLIAFGFMTLDHLGVILDIFFNIGAPGNSLYWIYAMLRILGRIAMPLFAFMVVEGVRYTKNYKKYALRLGIMAVIIGVVLCVCQFVPSLGMTDLANQGNIFLDLLLGSLAIYLLNNKKISIKLLALLPLAISILSYAAKGMEMARMGEQLWFPKFLRLQFDWMSVGLIIGFYFARFFTTQYFISQENKTGLKTEYIEGTPIYQTANNLFSILFLFIISILYYLGKYIAPNIQIFDLDIQLAMLMAGLFILVYNGKRGYNAKWFQYGSYLFYPVHILVLYAIVYLCSLIH